MSSKANRQPSHRSFFQRHITFTRIATIFATLGISLFFYFAAYANIALLRPSDTATTTVYFEKDGQPHDWPVDFTINCYGYFNSHQLRPLRLELFGEDPPAELVFSDSFDCPHYGCEVNIRYRFDWVQIEYCDCEGETEGRKFVIGNY